MRSLTEIRLEGMKSSHPKPTRSFTDGSFSFAPKELHDGNTKRPIIQVKKMRFMKVHYLAQTHTASES